MIWLEIKVNSVEFMKGPQETSIVYYIQYNLHPSQEATIRTGHGTTD